MISTKQLVFRLNHLYNDGWGFYRNVREDDQDLARDIMGLFNRVDPHLEDILASALAEHRRGLSNGRYVGEDDLD